MIPQQWKQLKSQGLFAQKPGPTLDLGSEWDPRAPALACFRQCPEPGEACSRSYHPAQDSWGARVEVSSSSFCRETGSSRPPGSSGSMDDKWTQARRSVASHENQPGPFTSCWRMKEKANKKKTLRSCLCTHVTALAHKLHLSCLMELHGLVL